MSGEPDIVKVHVTCRLKFTSKRRYDQQSTFATSGNDCAPPKTLRSSVDTFDWKQHCFLCGKVALLDDQKGCKKNIIFVRTLEIRETLLTECAGRTDDWSLDVLGRLHMCHDLIAAEAIYYKACRGSFSKLKCAISNTGEQRAVGSGCSTGYVFGRPINPEMSRKFEELCDWLENADTDLLTLSELHEKLCNLSNDN